MPTKITNDQIKFALEVWKTTIGVQEHFNNIEMQVRNFAISVLTATIGAAGLVYNQHQENVREAIKANLPIPIASTIHVFGLNLSSADMIIIAGMAGWLAFYLMDRWWYHKFLQGAVAHAQHIENRINKTQYGDLMLLSNAIREASHIKFLGIFNIKSDSRISLFYGIGFLFLLMLMIFVF